MTQLEALKAIAARDGGLLRPQAVVDEARDEESPLHGAFCWDNTEAARRYRIIQAQELIRSFRVEIEREGKSVKVPVFVNISSDRDGRSEDNPYRITAQVKDFPDLMETAVQDALDQLEGVRNRYAHLAELKDVWTAIDACVDKRRKKSA